MLRSSLLDKSLSLSDKSLSDKSLSDKSPQDKSLSDKLSLDKSRFGNSYRLEAKVSWTLGSWVSHSTSPSSGSGNKDSAGGARLSEALEEDGSGSSSSKSMSNASALLKTSLKASSLKSAKGSTKGSRGSEAIVFEPKTSLKGKFVTSSSLRFS